MQNVNIKPYHNDLILKQRGEDKYILLNLENSKYYSFDEVGNRIWNLCDGENTISTIITKLSQEYDVPLEELERDTNEFLENLTKEKIIYYKDE